MFFADVQTIGINQFCLFELKKLPWPYSDG